MDLPGVDFTGAMYVKIKGAVSDYKVYVCLFTCTSTRAIHLEVVTDLTEAPFLQAFCRFAAHRSVPQLVMLDNASTYTSAAKELNKLFQSPTLKSALMHGDSSPREPLGTGAFWKG